MWVSFLGFYLVSYYSRWLVLLPVFILNLARCTVVELVVEAAGVPPGHPFEGRDLDLKHVIPPARVDQLILTRSVDVLG